MFSQTLTVGFKSTTTCHVKFMQLAFENTEMLKLAQLELNIVLWIKHCSDTYASNFRVLGLLLSKVIRICIFKNFSWFVLTNEITTSTCVYILKEKKKKNLSCLPIRNN